MKCMRNQVSVTTKFRTCVQCIKKGSTLAPLSPAHIKSTLVAYAINAHFSISCNIDYNRYSASKYIT